MPGGFPLGLHACNCSDLGTDLANTRGTQITSGSANTKGAYTQLVASTASDAAFAIVGVFSHSLPNNGNTFLVDIAIGAAGSEIVIIPNIPMYEFNTKQGFCFSLPINIKAGSRISARCQSATGSDNLIVSMLIFDGAFEPEGIAGYDDLGSLTASSHGTPVLNPSSGTKGSFTQLVASTSRDYAGLIVCNQWDLSTLTLLDIAIGAAGSEIIIISNLPLVTFASLNGPVGFIPIEIPAGTRVSARVATDANGGSFISLIAGYQ